MVGLAETYGACLTGMYVFKKQTRTMTFEKVGRSLRKFWKGSAKLKKNLILRPNLRVYIQFLVTDSKILK